MINKEQKPLTEKNIMLWLGCIEKNIDDFNNEREMLKIKFGGEPGQGDVIWSLLNKETLSILRTVSEKYDQQSALKTNYYYMAQFLLTVENKNPFNLNHQIKKIELEQLKELEIYTKVRINTCHEGFCNEANNLKNKTLSVDDALKQMPIPSKACTNFEVNKSIPFCTCGYTPLTEDEY